MKRSTPFKLFWLDVHSCGEIWSLVIRYYKRNDKNKTSYLVFINLKARDTVFTVRSHWC